MRQGGLLRYSWFSVSLPACILVAGVWFASACSGGPHQLGAASAATTAQAEASAFETESNQILASHHLELERVDENSLAVPTEATLRAALHGISLPTEFAEPPRRMRFSSPIPGVPITDGRDVWGVAVLAANAIVPTASAGSRGAYAVVFYSETSGRIEYAIAGECVLN